MNVVHVCLTHLREKHVYIHIYNIGLVIVDILNLSKFTHIYL